MRLSNRDKQTIYVANEKRFGSGDYDEPIKLRVLIAPLNHSVTNSLGSSTQQNAVEITSEANQKGIDKITQNSKVWINVQPDEDGYLGDNTHEITSRDRSTNRWFVLYTCKSSLANFPL